MEVDVPVRRSERPTLPKQVLESAREMDSHRGFLPQNT